MYKFTVDDKTQLTSLVFENIELLHDGKESWMKQFPIIFPVVSFSDAFEINGVNYDIPKHGFWWELEWNRVSHPHYISFESNTSGRKDYPFNLELKIEFISIKEKFKIITTIKNVDDKTAYFHFGYHPALKIDKQTIIKYNEDGIEINNDGKLGDGININDVNVRNIPFEKDFDTIVFKEPKTKTLNYNYGNFDISVSWDSTNLQLWKPGNAKFLCIEPWDGAGDREQELISNAPDKKYINSLKPNTSFVREMIIETKK